MKILVLADIESKYYWDYFEKEKLDGIDLILSCGDLKPQYLSFIASFTKAPVLYVHGNHDDCYENNPPEGCVCIENMVYSYNGVRILGIGGSVRYKQGKNQYTQKEMNARVKHLWFKIKRKKGFDILLTHAPAKGINDGEDRVHGGFEAFLALLDKYKPKYFFHGHVHKNYQKDFKREFIYNQSTTIINGYEYYIVEYNDN